ncbi:hypothetical protein [Sediminimonas qiaohouensis]|uniref:hypothetical protein n=1 Tax=Sediminimonas qiaohouensis TaxID=552061 RepID=UPI0003FC55DB|nr:hypothetical protein [Sediminimonas qiaohouensis]
MAYDLTTEAIAHFIGSFDQVVEEARWRISYDPFKGDGPEFTDPGNLHTVTLNVSAPYQLNGFDPGIDYDIDLPPLPDRFVPISVYLKPDFMPNNHTPFAFELDNPAQLPQSASFAEAPVVFIPPPPSSIATVIVQSNWLSDSDTLMGLDGGTFVSPVAQDLALGWLASVADTLGGPTMPGPPANGNTIKDTAYDAKDAVADFKVAAAAEAGIYTLTDEQWGGTHVNGTLVEGDDVPTLKDALPELPEPNDGVGPAHEVVLGGNTVVNEAYIDLAMADAPVIAAMGNSLSVSSISQVNVLSDHDTINGAVQSAGAASNVMMNISTALTLAANSGTDYTEDQHSDEDPTFPSFASVVRLDGDLVNVNYLRQDNHVVDNDIVSKEFGASETFIQTGGNLVLNAATLAQMTYSYDLIVVGGDIINVSMINQINVLLDDDFITYPQDADWTISSGENVLWNQAAIQSVGQDNYQDMPAMFKELGNSLASGSDSVSGEIRSLEQFEGRDSINVLYIEGDLISVQLVYQINVVGDSDQIWQGGPHMEGGGTDASVTAGSNTLANLAVISEFGFDSDIYVGGDTYSDALMHQAGLVVMDESELAGEGEGGLVNEAVAFLMDGTDQQTDDGATAQSGYVHEDALGNDPMGGMVA